jgi:hypothetical protein
MRLYHAAQEDTDTDNHAEENKLKLAFLHILLGERRMWKRVASDIHV